MSSEGLNPESKLGSKHHRHKDYSKKQKSSKRHRPKGNENDANKDAIAKENALKNGQSGIAADSSSKSDSRKKRKHKHRRHSQSDAEEKSKKRKRDKHEDSGKGDEKDGKDVDRGRTKKRKRRHHDAGVIDDTEPRDSHSQENEDGSGHEVTDGEQLGYESSERRNKDRSPYQSNIVHQDTSRDEGHISESGKRKHKKSKHGKERKRPRDKRPENEPGSKQDGPKSINGMTNYRNQSPPAKQQQPDSTTQDEQNASTSLPLDLPPSPSSQPPTAQPPQANVQLSKQPLQTRAMGLIFGVPPISTSHPLPGLCAEHLSPLLLTYFAPLRGIVLSYSDPFLSNAPPDATTLKAKSHPTNDATTPILARSTSEYAAPLIYLTATFTLFTPHPGRILTGHPTLQTETHISLLVYNLFPATIQARRLPRPWRWTSSNPHDSSLTTAAMADADDARVRSRRKKSSHIAPDPQQDTTTGHYRTPSGPLTPSTPLTFTVLSSEQGPFVTPSSGGVSARGRALLGIAGTMLGGEEEAEAMREDEREARDREVKAGAAKRERERLVRQRLEREVAERRARERREGVVVDADAETQILADDVA